MEDQEVFIVVWVGEMFDTVSMPMHDVEVYSTLEKARARVQTWFDNRGRGGWEEIDDGIVWYNKDENAYISIVGDTVG